MQLYQFEKIYSQMEREFGKIRKGEEETYAMLLLPMEGNVLKIHREFPGANSRRLREAIALALFDIKVNYSGEEYDTEKPRPRAPRSKPSLPKCILISSKRSLPIPETVFRLWKY